MHTNYKQILEKYTKDVKINEQLAKQLHTFSNKFVNKNEDHIAFFGSNLTGVQSIYFTTMDKNELMIDILDGVNDIAIRKEIKALPYVGSSWQVATEPVTLVCMYLVYKFYNSSLPEKVKKQAMTDLSLIVHYKFITSLINHYFPYNIPETTALATYSALSRKFTLKQEGTWQKTLERRVDDLLFVQDSWMEQIKTYVTDEDLIKMFSDMQVRMRSMIKNIAEVTYRLHSQGVGVDSGASMMETDDGLKVKDVQRLHSTYRDYLHSIVVDPKALIKAELVHVIGEAIVTMPESPLFDVLLYLSTKAQENDRNTIKFCDEIMMYVFNYLQEESRNGASITNLSNLLEKIKSLITASKSNDPAVLQLRRDAERYVKKGCKVSNPASQAGLRTGLILYLTIRALTKQHYS